MLKTGRLDRKYDGIFECFRRTAANEGVVSLWRGNTANVIRYFPTQALNFAFRDTYKSMFAYKKERDGYAKWMMGNLASGGVSGISMSPKLARLTQYRLPVRRLFSSSTPWITPVLVLPTTPKTLRRAVLANSMAWSMYTRRPWRQTESLVYTVALVLQWLGLLSTVVSTLACTTRSNLFSLSVPSKVTSWPPSCSDGRSLLVLVSAHTPWTLSVVV